MSDDSAAGGGGGVGEGGEGEGGGVLNRNLGGTICEYRAIFKSVPHNIGQDCRLSRWSRQPVTACLLPLATLFSNCSFNKFTVHTPTHEISTIGLKQRKGNNQKSGVRCNTDKQ